MRRASLLQSPGNQDPKPGWTKRKGKSWRARAGFGAGAVETKASHVQLCSER